MEIELSKDLEQIINSAMLTGKFKSPEECIIEGIKALKLQWLNDELQTGLDELDKGKGEPYNRDKINEEVERQLKNL